MSRELWPHLCAAEHGLIWTGEGEPCNWCDERQQVVCDDPEPPELPEKIED